jgi:uncharacterized protein (TIGR01777 family)
MPDETFALRSPMPVSAAELYDWHARPGAFERLNPPWEPVSVVGREGAFGTAPFRVRIRTPVLGPVKTTFLSEAFDFRPGEGFKDRQLTGPFAAWTHTHTMTPDGPDRSVLEDRIDYRLPLGGLGRLFGGGLVRKRLGRMFAYRHALQQSDFRRHAPYHDRPRLTIAVTGSRGLIGTDLVPFLTTGGHRVVRLVTGTPNPPPFDDGTTWVGWKPDARPDPAVLAGCDAVIHLAGDNVADGRWSAKKKRRILDSRTIPTRHLADAIAALPADRRPKVFVSASAIGYYGDRGDEELTEESLPGTGFFRDVCEAWEAAASPAADAGVRVVHPRIGVVLTPKGAALGKQLAAFKAGGGAVLGRGTQWVAWVTVNDVVGALHHCLMEDVSGPVNFTAPHPVTNRDFTKTLARVLRRPAVLRLPRAALHVLFGEIADAALLVSLRVLPRKLLDSGFAFDHTELEAGLRFLLGR